MNESGRHIWSRIILPLTPGLARILFLFLSVILCRRCAALLPLPPPAHQDTGLILSTPKRHEILAEGPPQSAENRTLFLGRGAYGIVIKAIYKGIVLSSFTEVLGINNILLNSWYGCRISGGRQDSQESGQLQPRIAAQRGPRPPLASSKSCTDL